MNTDFKTGILKILEAIEYKDDKEAFANEFISLTQMQAIADLMQTLPQEQQEQIKTELSADPNNAEKAAQVIYAHFSQEQLQKASEIAATKGVTAWMQAVEPTLSDTQKQKLLTLKQEFQQLSQSQ